MSKNTSVFQKTTCPTSKHMAKSCQCMPSAVGLVSATTTPRMVEILPSIFEKINLPQPLCHLTMPTVPYCNVNRTLFSYFKDLLTIVPLFPHHLGFAFCFCTLFLGKLFFVFVFHIHCSLLQSEPNG